MTTFFAVEHPVAADGPLCGSPLNRSVRWKPGPRFLSRDLRPCVGYNDHYSLLPC